MMHWDYKFNIYPDQCYFRFFLDIQGPRTCRLLSILTRYLRMSNLTVYLISVVGALVADNSVVFAFANEGLLQAHIPE